MSFPSPQAGLSGLKLSTLGLSVFDTETTGLDTARDRIIEIAAVRVDTGQVDETDIFSKLVNPDMPIPGSSTRIHGIRDSDIADAPEFASAMAAFTRWTGPSVMVGYSIAFDLAIFRAEHDRHGLDWQPPRTLDVRDLAQLLSPNLPDLSLETLAGWLGISTEGRHRALADAVMTAHVFVALLPRLKERRIETLAEAERACADRQAPDVSRALPDQTSRAEPEYARIDSFPYRHRVGDVMTTIVSAAPDLSVSGALARMSTSRVSALFVMDGAEGETGIITERDILEVIHDRGAAALTVPIGDVCSRPLITVGQDEFLYRALVTLSSGSIRHLGVINSENRLVGALSARSLLRQRAGDIVSLGHEIETATTPNELGRIWSGLTTVARSLADERVDARDIASVISRELRALTRRACQIAEVELGETDPCPLPGAWTMLVLGSGGRGESLLAMDQDNAIVIGDGPVGSDPDRWCERLGQRVADILDTAGVHYCKGGVMSCNPEWRHDIPGWRATVSAWISRTRPEDILNADIFFDAAPVHGDSDLAEDLRQSALQEACKAVPFLQLLARRAAEYHLPLGMLGRFKSERGRIDLKMGGIMPLFSTARVIALRHGSSARSTPERLRLAVDAGEAPASTVNDLLKAHEILLGLILRQQLSDVEQGIPLSNRVAPGSLDGYRRQELKWALTRIPTIADVLGVPPDI